MSLHALANHMASKGRGGDSMLVHMTPGEVAGLHALALKHGGSLTVNPDTGLVEAGFLKKLLPMIAGFALGPAGFGLMSAAGAGLTVGAATGLATGSLSKGLMAGLGAYGGAGLGEAFMGTGASQLVGAGAPIGVENIAGSAVPPIEQINPSNFGLSSADKLGAGFKAVTDSPSAFGQFAKDNWKMGLAAASPFIADAMVPTTTKMPTAPSTGYIRPFQYDANTHTVKAMDPVLASEWGARQFPDFIPRTQPQTPPPRPGMATGGIVALANGGAADPYAQYNTLSGQSKNAYDYLMGDASSVDAAPIPTFNRPVVSNTNAPPPPPPAAPTSAPTPVSTPAPIPTPMPEPTPEPVMPSPDEDFPPTPQPVMPSPDEDFPPTPQPVMPSPDEDFPSTYPEPVMPSPDEDFPSTPEPRELEDKSYWDDTNSPEPVGPTRGQPELPEEFDRYLQPEPVMPSPDADFPSTYPEPSMPSPDADFPSTFSNDTGYGLGDTGGFDFGNSGEVGESVSGNYGGFDADASGGSDVYGLGGYDFGSFGGFGGGIRNYELQAESQMFANGGIIPQYAMGGLGSLGGYSDGGRLLKGPGDGVSDSIPATIGAKKQPARLADGEFVVPARIVSELGNGSTDAGARKLYAMMNRIQKSRGKTVGKGKVATNTRADKYLPA